MTPGQTACQLVRDGHYLTGIELFSSIIATSNEPLNFVNRGFAYLSMDRYGDALSDFENARARYTIHDTGTDSCLENIGACLILLERDNEASSVFRETMHIVEIGPPGYSDSWGLRAALLLLGCAVRLDHSKDKSDAEVFLKRIHAKNYFRKHSRESYFTIVRFFLGDITIEQARTDLVQIGSIQSAIDVCRTENWERNEICPLFYHAFSKHLIYGGASDARKYLDIIDKEMPPAPFCLEWHLAKFIARKA